MIGSGPIVIGQAAEFDYSGAQACKVLLEEGYEVILVNSNPATIMTDPEFATADLHRAAARPASVTKVIEREKPDALLPTLGGGTALDLARQLSEDGTLGKHRRGADRRRLRGHPPRRGPRAVPLHHGARRPQGPAQRGGQVDARGRARRCPRSVCRRSCGRASRWAAPAAASRGTRPSTAR